jgi:serine/threonine protein kinase
LKICAGVAFSHRNLIIHRDIKPSNILITNDRDAKLLDFGLAKILDFENDEAQTATAFRALTPAYASPEQLRGETVTTASDIYSLGVVLYELLTGSRPYKFKTNSLEEIIRHVSIDEPTKPSQIEATDTKFKIQNY